MRQFLIVVAVILVGCGTGTIDEVDVMQGDIYSQDDPIIQDTINAINLGVQDGDQFMTFKVNEVLQGFNVKYFYQGMTTLTEYNYMATPDVGGPDNCPYVGPKAVAGNDTGPQSCQFLAEQALEAAKMATNGPDANKAIDESFGGAENLALFRSWYANGANNTMDVTAVLLAGTKSTGTKYWYGYVNPAGPDTWCAGRGAFRRLCCRYNSGGPGKGFYSDG